MTRLGGRWLPAYPAAMERIAQFALRHWRGQVPLPVTLVLTLAGLHAGVVALWLGAADAGPFVALLALGAGIAVLVWQLVGGFRAADRAMHGFGGMQSATLGYLAVLAVGISGLYHAAGVMAHQSAAPLPHALAPPPTGGISRDGARLLLDGTITLDSYREAQRLIGQGGLNVIVLNSGGGNVHAARGMARLIGEVGMDTRVAGRCHSACTLIFMAGAGRDLAPGGRLGFHGYRLGGFEAGATGLYDDVATEQARDRRFLAARGVSAGFLARAYATGADTIWEPRRDELLRAGVLTR